MSSSQQAADNLTMKRLRKPTIDPERIVIEPVLCVMHNSITPFTRISAGVYDFTNRRWCELNVEQEIADEQWIERKVRQYIDGAVHPFNAISIDKHGDVRLELVDPLSGRITAILDWETAGWMPEYWEYRKARYGRNDKKWWVDIVHSIMDPYEREWKLDSDLEWC
jgi:hypothetical protein